MLPHVDLDEVQQRDDVEGPRLRPRRLAVEEEVEKLEADWVALYVESGARRRLVLDTVRIEKDPDKCGVSIGVFYPERGKNREWEGGEEGEGERAGKRGQGTHDHHRTYLFSRSCILSIFFEA